MRESGREKQETKCGCPPGCPPGCLPATSLGRPVVNKLDVSLEQTETNGTTNGPIINTFGNSENYTLAGTMKEAILQPCDEGAPAGICWNDDRVSCPKEHQEARCLFLWNNGMTAKVKEEEKEEVQVKEEEETSSVHFFLEQLVGDDGWRECVEVEILCPIIILEKNKLLASSALFY